MKVSLASAFAHSPVFGLKVLLRTDSSGLKGCGSGSGPLVASS